MAKRKVLIATPLKGDIPKSYFLSSLQLYAANIPDVKLDWFLLDGPAIQVARCELAYYAMQNKFDEVIFWDKDVVAEDENHKNVSAGAIMRLLSHDVDFVCGLYSTRDINTHWHVQTIEGEEAGKDGLQKVKRCAIGFSKMKVDMLREMCRDNPDREVLLIDPNNPPRTMTELFPMGISGKNTPEFRLKNIAEFLTKAKQPEANLDAATILARIDRELTVRYDEPNLYIGEDYWFCDLARASGYDVHLDTMLVLGHKANVTVPIPTKDLIKMLGESWRNDELKELKSQLLAVKKAHEL